MTGVLESAPATANEKIAGQTGGFIWYELMTADPAGAKAFYDAVVGWVIADQPDPGAGGMDYRMIERSDRAAAADGGNAGGVLKLTQDMLDGGAHPCWLGYISVADVDQAVDAIVADGGKVQMPATDLPVGRIAMVTDPQGAPFYVMTPKGPEGLASERLLDSMRRSTFAGMNWRRPTRTPRSISTSVISVGTRKATWIWAKWANTVSSRATGSTSARLCRRCLGCRPAFGPITLVSTTSIARQRRSKAAEAGSSTAQWKSRAANSPSNGLDPQGAAFGLVGPRK